MFQQTIKAFRATNERHGERIVVLIAVEDFIKKYQRKDKIFKIDEPKL